MSGTLIIQAASADLSANPAQIILPGSLASGLEGFFYLNQSLALATRNLAPGGVQAAAAVGAPTVGNGFLNLQTGAKWINSGILETPALTIIWAGRTDDPMTVNDLYWNSNETADASQGSGNVGMRSYVQHSTGPTSISQFWACYFGATFATRAQSPLLNMTAQNVTNWNLWAGTVQSVSPFLVRLRNLTTGAAVQGNGSTGRWINTVQPYLIGNRPTGGGNAIMQVAAWTKWNRDLSDTECANVRSLVIAPYLSDKFGITV